VTQRISEIEVTRRVRFLLANRLIAFGWALKGSCKPCAHWLFTSARWLVPEAQRFLVQCRVSHNRNRRIREFAVAPYTLLRGIQPRVVAGFLIVLAFLGSLDLALRTTATVPQPLRHEPQIPSESVVSESPEAMQEFVTETASLPKAQIAPVPLPMKKPEVVYKVPSGKGAKSNSASQKRMAQQKRAPSKPIR
jgi:hypothetical protein